MWIQTQTTKTSESNRISENLKQKVTIKIIMIITITMKLIMYRYEN
jgi:hypothetical protein